MNVSQTLRWSAALVCLASITGCSGTSPKPSITPADTITSITINPQKTYQKIEHFGASDAWACQFVGNWPSAKKEAIADLLFSTEVTSSGQPRGIGLSIWRFNIGAGTAEQGTNSGIRDEWRRAEGFLNDDGTYDWNKQAAQLWFLNAAKQRGVSSFLAFTNSPPVQFTTNKKGFATEGKPNLQPTEYGKFTDFLTTVLKGIHTKTGIMFDYISPVNEPQWDWSDGGQEGTPFYNNQIADLTRSLSAGLKKQNLPVKISIAEAGQIDYLYSEFNKQGRQNQISDFFTKGSDNYVGDLSNLVPAISGHSYFTTSPYAKAEEKRKKIAAAMASHPELRYWMSEYCILGDNEGELNAQGKDLGIDPAIYIAKVIHNDLVNAQATAWHWWLAISAYNYKDGLVYVDKNKTDGSYAPAKMLWALGQYSRFIRPDAVRIDAQTNRNGLLVSAYKNKDNRTVVVVINPQTTSQTVQLSLPTTKVTTYTTSAQSDLSPGTSQAGKPVTIAGKSIVTFVTEP